MHTETPISGLGYLPHIHNSKLPARRFILMFVLLYRNFNDVNIWIQFSYSRLYAEFGYVYVECVSQLNRFSMSLVLLQNYNENEDDEKTFFLNCNSISRFSEFLTV